MPNVSKYPRGKGTAADVIVEKFPTAVPNDIPKANEIIWDFISKRPEQQWFIHYSTKDWRANYDAFSVELVAKAKASAMDYVQLEKLLKRVPSDPFIQQDRFSERACLPIGAYRGFPGVIKESYFQDFADRLKIVIVGFPATTELGDDTQQWSEEPVADHAYIQERLRVLAQKHDLDISRTALFGFSQGAMVAADLCTRFPDSYAGAIVMSPGGMTNPQASTVPGAKHRDQLFWVVCMAEEHPGNVELTRAYAKHLKALGSKVTKIEYPGIKEHTRPPDFKDRFPEWIGAILKIDEKKEE